jgi:hypothetical protein
MPLVPTPARLKLLHACDQWHSSRMFAAFLLVGTVNSVQTLQAHRVTRSNAAALTFARAGGLVAILELKQAAMMNGSTVPLYDTLPSLSANPLPSNQLKQAAMMNGSTTLTLTLTLPLTLTLTLINPNPNPNPNREFHPNAEGAH